MSEPQQSDHSYLAWAVPLTLIGGIVGLGYVAYKGAQVVLPYALAYDNDPEMLARYQTWKQGSPEARKTLMIDLAKQFGEESRKRRAMNALPVVKNGEVVINDVLYAAVPKQRMSTPNLGAPVVRDGEVVIGDMLYEVTPKQRLGKTPEYRQNVSYDAPADSPARKV